MTIPAHTGRARRPGIRVHRSITLTPAGHHHATAASRSPSRTARSPTSPARIEGRQLEQAVNRAERLIDWTRLERSAPPSLQAGCGRYATAQTRSELEERFLRLCDDHGIPRPETNARIEGFEVDFVWRDRRLVVEVDGYAHHRSPAAFERDRERT